MVASHIAHGYLLNDIIMQTLPFTDALKLLGYLKDWISAGDQVCC